MVLSTADRVALRRACLPKAQARIESHGEWLSSFLPSNDTDLIETFRNAYSFNVMHNLTSVLDDGRVFVKTGDISYMWLRDSAAQFHPYLSLLGRHDHNVHDECVAELFRGLIETQAFYILMDPFANAFHEQPTFTDREWGRGGYVATRNYELDSLGYFLRLSHKYWSVTGDASVFDTQWRLAVESIMVLWEMEQRPGNSHKTRTYFYADLTNGGFGNATDVNPSSGLTWQPFRPSDDKTKYGFNIPGNYFALTTLGYADDILEQVYDDARLAAQARSLRSSIAAGLQQHGTVDTPDYGTVLAYETNAYGPDEVLLMDDANVPSLLSLPYMTEEGELPAAYDNTRSFILSDGNPCFYSGVHAQGIGSPHTDESKSPICKHRRERVWPMALVMEALTTDDSARRLQLVQTCVHTTSDHLLHESFDVNNPTMFSRTSFGWPNALFAELVEDMLYQGELGQVPLSTPHPSYTLSLTHVSPTTYLPLTSILTTLVGVSLLMFLSALIFRNCQLTWLAGERRHRRGDNSPEASGLVQVQGEESDTDTEDELDMAVLDGEGVV